MANQIIGIAPYWVEKLGVWAFDDDRYDLVQELLIAGADKYVTWLTEQEKIENAQAGFRLLFSPGPFPGAHRLDWVREDDGGNWYHSKEAKIDGWLCPALFHYFEEAPEVLYAKAEAKTDDK